MAACKACERSQTGRDEPGQLFVQTEAGDPHRDIDVRSREQHNSGLIRETNILELEGGNRSKD